MRYDEVGYEKKIRKDGVIFYELQWSKYLHCKTKFVALKRFTEMTGIYIVFYMNNYKRLTPIMLGASWYSGLRSSILRLFDDITVSSIPKHIVSKIKNEDIYIKYLEVYELDDFLNMFFVLKESYNDIFIDTNGLSAPKDINLVKIIDKKTKKYFKSKENLDI